MTQVVCITNLYGSHHLQRPLWKGTWKSGKPTYGFSDLTIGKVYHAIYVKTYNNIGENDNYRIVDDNGKENLYPKSIFKPLEELREEKLGELLK